MEKICLVLRSEFEGQCVTSTPNKTSSPASLPTSMGLTRMPFGLRIEAGIEIVTSAVHNLRSKQSYNEIGSPGKTSP